MHVVLYSALLVATPFIMLQAFLQDAIGQLSATTFPLGPLKVPVVLLVALLVAGVLLARFRASLTRARIAAGLTALLMIALAQQVTDYYFNHHFYELQQNWHYIAYCLFAFMLYRDLRPRGLPEARIMLLTFLAAVLYSSFDEGFQRHMSNRIFDIGDIAKDGWGAMAGLVMIHLGQSRTAPLGEAWKRLRHRRLGDYFRHPPSTLLLLGVTALIFVGVSSLLTDYAYCGIALLLTLGGGVLFFLLLHLTRRRWARYALAGVLAAAILLQTGFFLRYRRENIVHHQYGLTVYKGLAIPFFDVLFFPGGGFRLVDKKHDFKSRDRQFLLRQEADILLIGSGDQGKGGNGFPEKGPSQFIYNPHTHRGTQVIILESDEACAVFNRLKAAGKNVLFVLHSTC